MSEIQDGLPIPRRTPSLLVVARQQLRLIDATKRFPLMLAVFAGISAVALGPGPVGIPEGVFPFISILMATIAWPVLVWSGESPAKRGYHRILPVNHVTHDLLKVLAGACWLTLACGIILATLIAITLATGFAEVIGGLSLTVFASYFTAPLIVYLLVSVIPILTNKPIEWMLGLAVGVGVWDAMTSLYPRGDIGSAWWWVTFVVNEFPAHVFNDVRLGLGMALFGGYVDQPWYFLFGLSDRPAPGVVYVTDASVWLTATAFWIVVGIAAVTWASVLANRRAEAGRA
jgi:hypothetical protein